jgi:hypothetical protein
MRKREDKKDRDKTETERTDRHTVIDLMGKSSEVEAVEEEEEGVVFL